jgi:hypothetical protein
MNNSFNDAQCLKCFDSKFVLGDSGHRDSWWTGTLMNQSAGTDGGTGCDDCSEFFIPALPGTDSYISSEFPGNGQIRSTLFSHTQMLLFA